MLPGRAASRPARQGWWLDHGHRRNDDGPAPSRTPRRSRPHRPAVRPADGGRSAQNPRAGARQAGNCSVDARPADDYPADDYPADDYPLGGYPAGEWPAGDRASPNVFAPAHPRGTARTHRRASRRPYEAFLAIGDERDLTLTGPWPLLARRPREPARSACRPVAAGWQERAVRGRRARSYGRVSSR